MKKERYILASVGMFLAALVFLTVSARASVPGTPEQFKSSVLVDQKGQTFVRLEWKLNQSGGLPQYFVINKAAGHETDLAKFSKLTKVAPVSKDSGRTYQLDYKYDVYNLSAGEYSFHLYAFNADGSSPATQIEYAVIQQGGGISFTSTPPKYGYVGKEYTYDAEARSGTPGEIHFTGMSMPAGATLDSITGLFRFTPAAEGVVSFGIKAYLAADPSVSAIQQISITVKKDSGYVPTPPCAVITGSIVDASGNPITSGSVKAYAVDSTGQHAVGTISNGTFRIGVKQGTYIMYAFGSGFTSEWYRDASSSQTAERIIIACNDSVHVSMTVEKQVQKMLSGTVVSEGDNLPQLATILVKSKDGTQKFSTTTDQAGNYSIALPAGVEYIVSAYPKNSGYYVQYYNGVQDIALATPVLMDADKSGINFVLVKKPTFQNGIKGAVKDSAGNGLISLITAYLMQNQKPDQKYSFTASTDSMGGFELKSLQPGEYILFAQPSNKDFIPGYYKENAIAVQAWDQATRITVTDNGYVTGKIVQLQKRWGLRGIAILQGTVAGRTGVAPGGEQPLAGAFILLRDPSGRVSDYGFSDVTGAYRLTEAAAGTCTVTIDRIGYVPFSASVTFNYSDRIQVNMPVVMQPASATSVSEPRLTPDRVQLNVYPNPAHAVIHVTARGLQSNARLTVYNRLGIQVYNTLISGDNPAGTTISTAPFDAGVYFLRLEGGTSHGTTAFTVVR